MCGSTVALLLATAPGLAFETGDPAISASSKGGAPVPVTAFAREGGRATLTIDMGRAALGRAASGTAAVRLPFTVAETGEWVRVRRSFAAELLGATVRGTFQVKRVRKSPTKVPGTKTSMRIAPLARKAGRGGDAVAVGESADFVGRLAPGGYVLTLKLRYAKGAKGASWNNAAFPASPHRIVVDAPGLRHVDAAAPAGGDGSPGRPFANLADALAAAGDGDVIPLAPGTYDGVFLAHGVTLAGAGAAGTRVDGPVVVTAPAGSGPVTLAGLSMPGILYGSTTTPSVPVTIRSCALDALEVVLPPGGDLMVERSVVAGDATVIRADADADATVRSSRFDRGLVFTGNLSAGKTLVTDCDVGDDLRLTQARVTGDQIVTDSRIGGAVMISATSPASDVAGAAHRVTGCEIGGGIGAALSACGIRVTGNTLTGGSIDLAIAAHGQTGPQWVDSNDVRDGTIDLVVSGAAIEVRANRVRTAALVDADGEPTVGLRVRGGTGAIIAGNTVAVPYAVAVSDDASDDVRGIDVISGATTEVSGNHVKGGARGLFVIADPGVIEDNTISGSHVGAEVVVVGAFRGNSIVGCKGDGVRIVLNGPFEWNTVTGNGGAGVRFDGTDLGGGPAGSRGGNTLRGNGGFDLVIESLAADAATVPAAGNRWDHRKVAGVDAFDVFDGKDDPKLTTVILTASGGP